MSPNWEVLPNTLLNVINDVFIILLMNIWEQFMGRPIDSWQSPLHRSHLTFIGERTNREESTRRSLTLQIRPTGSCFVSNITRTPLSSELCVSSRRAHVCDVALPSYPLNTKSVFISNRDGLSCLAVLSKREGTDSIND